jgi:hypothetical protein
MTENEPPALGSKARGDTIGKTGSQASAYYVRVQCPGCMTDRWATPKGQYQAALNRIRHCVEHARLIQKHNFNLSTEQNPEVRGF